MENYIIDGEVVDTYGGDFTYRYVWYEIEDDNYSFYEMCTGAKASGSEKITDRLEIEELMEYVR